MNKFFSFLIIAILLTGCTPLQSKVPLNPPQKSGTEILEKPVKKPRIPKASDLKASILESWKLSPEEETEELLKEIEKRIEEPPILYEDIERGWYYGAYINKKLGTPSTWVWVEEGDKSRWMSPNAFEETSAMAAKDLCRLTAGTYVNSCIETESEDCEQILKNECRCIEGSKWNEKQGCILTDTEGNFAAITEEELKQGWYRGLPNQKKLNTPMQWVWIDAGMDSQWKNATPSD